MKQKSEVSPIFLKFKAMVELQLNTKIKSLQFDRGGEYIALSHILSQFGITHRISCPYTPQQNGTAERKNRHIAELGLSMLAHATMPLMYWDEAFLTAVHVINSLPTPLLSNKTPYEKLFHTPQSYSHFRTFGCLCFPNLRPYNKHKLQFRSVSCTFLGYSSSHKGYRCLDPQGRIYISRDVLFDESTFPFLSSSHISSSSSPPTSNSSSLPSIPLVIPSAASNASYITNSSAQVVTGSLTGATVSPPLLPTPFTPPILFWVFHTLSFSLQHTNNL